MDGLLSRRVDAIIVAGARFGDRNVLEAATRFTPVVIAVRGIPGARCRTCSTTTGRAGRWRHDT